ncbi:MAG: hypothetical protein PHT02_00045 [Tissierellia bacterium]|nr:hypothetical protein [Tissierellia bacterium]
MKKIIKVKDNNGKYNNWIIYGETKDSFKIYADCDKSYITEIYKTSVFRGSIKNVNGEYEYHFISVEIKNPFLLMPEWYGKAEFCEIRLKNGEC